ncbi:hypothetical protein STAS_04502 [Striga asiatica]|uniref:Senescence regulator n=1 Tax=Striga asiatica TaxID=4170 RepID=A0A5A7P7F1_STRAF|nr:hypothetical protein STAS_04502 [Striga asiatica]
MAAAKSHRYLSPFAAEIRDRFDLELDEADVWGAAAADGDAIRVEPRKPALGTRPIRNPARKAAPGHAGPRSLPVGVPDWSRILGGAYRPRAAAWAEECGGGWEEDDEEEERLPPHEYLARSRGASLSVHEGVGRTLKGRDLSRVRDAIWKQTGFED